MQAHHRGLAKGWREALTTAPHRLYLANAALLQRYREREAEAASLRL